MENPRIALIVKGMRFLVDKQRIIQKSRYFTSLYSHNFSDSNTNEHTIHYKIAPSVIEDFCSWIEEDPPSNATEESSHIKVSLQKYLSDNFQQLKEFVHLSTIYSVDELSAELTDVIIQQWLQPCYLLEIWRMSREEGLTALADVSFAACLDRFAELPKKHLLEAPDTDFLKLVCSVNIKTPTERLLQLLDAKLQRLDCEESDPHVRAKLQRLKGMLGNPDRRPKDMHCFFTEVLDHNRELVSRGVNYFHQDGSPSFGELVEVWRLPESGEELAGMGVIGKDFSVYKVGGEHKLGSCKFNMNVWRYCLISRKWYYLARLRKTRRHMVIAIVKNKLILVGGVGRYRLKTSSVEVLDLYTAEWMTGPEVPDTFTTVPPSCVMQDILVICNSNIYMYNAQKNIWIWVTHEINLGEFCNVECLASYENTLFIGKAGKTGGRYVGYEVTWSYDDSDGTINGAHIARSKNKFFKSPCEKIMIDEYAKVTGIAYDPGRVSVECGQLVTHQDTTTVKSQLHTFTPETGHLIPISCFNLTDPATLHKQIID